MKIETERLEIVALTPGQLKLWVNNLSNLEQTLNCSYKGEPVAGIFREIVTGQIKIVKEDAINYLWHGFWFIIRKSDRVVVGSADFKNKPDRDGNVEIGYGLGKEFEKKGYMTEAVGALCDWALKQDGLSHILAETEFDGLASQRVLKRCGFTEYSRDSNVWWRR